MDLKPRNTRLSKSTLIKSIQCQKALYLYKYHYELRDPVSRRQQAIFNRGHRVGKLAQQLFPGGKDCTPPSIRQYDQAIQATKALVLAQEPVIYEAAFRFQGILAALDMLVHQDGKWYAYEVKSSVRISKTYLQDAAIQYYVISNSGVPIEDFFLVHVNGSYRKKGELDVQKFFTMRSVKEDILALQDDIQINIDHARNTLLQQQVPEIEIGTHCYRPYTCDFISTCWQGKEKSPILQLTGVDLEQKINWIKGGYYNYSDIPMEEVDSKRAQIQMEASTQTSPYINQQEFDSFMSQLNYPLYFFDIEAFQPAIPIHDGTTPFHLIPFLYSLHYALSDNQESELTQYISPTDQDDRENFIRSFIEFTQKPGHILVFNTHLERRILYDLAKKYPQYASDIQDRLQRMIDLELVFKNDWFYHAKMDGSYSMKSILPALVDSWNYDDMELSDGVNAMVAYEQLVLGEFVPDPEQTIRNLLDYCKLDTYGLYLVFKKLKQYQSETK